MRIEVRRAGDLVWLQITANAYLHHMVRNIVGTLLDVQREADPRAAMAKVLAGARSALRRNDRARRRAVPVASRVPSAISAIPAPGGEIGCKLPRLSEQSR